MRFATDPASNPVRTAFALVVASIFLVLSGVQARAGETPKPGAEAPDFTLKTIKGKEVRLADTSKEGSVVLVVLRGYPGYQCPLCTAQVAELVARAKAIEETKARVILVYPGPADGLKGHAEEFLGSKTLPENFEFVIDPDYTFTSLYGLRWEAPRETAYPSTFVLNPERKVVFSKVSHSHGDRAKTSDILDALKKK